MVRKYEKTYSPTGEKTNLFNFKYMGEFGPMGMDFSKIAALDAAAKEKREGDKKIEAAKEKKRGLAKQNLHEGRTLGESGEIVYEQVPGLTSVADEESSFDKFSGPLELNGDYDDLPVVKGSEIN